VSGFVDRGAVTAAYVGIGMAVTIGISFLLIIPIEPIVWYLTLPGALLIGYYANQRSDRRVGPWPRILANGLFAGAAIGITLAALLLTVKAIFFFADTGYPDFNRVNELRQPIPPRCDTGADCVYKRYLAADRGADLAAAGVADPRSFSALYWGQQVPTAGMLLLVAMLGGLGGGALYGIFRPKRPAEGVAGTETRPA